MVKKNNNKNVYNFTLYFKIKLFLHHIYLITPSVYKARSYYVFILKGAATHAVTRGH